MRLGILQLPYNIDNFKQILDNLQTFDGEVFFLDDASKLKLIENCILPDNFELISCDPFNAGSIVNIAKDRKLDNVISFSELGLRTAAIVRSETGFEGHNEEIELNSIDKYRMRTILAEHGLTSVQARRCGADRLYEIISAIKLPVIVKPANLTGSICVQLIKNPGEIHDYLSRADNNPYAKNCDFVIESYIEGDEYSVEGLLLDGQVYIYGITEKITTGAPYFVEIGHAFHAQHPLLRFVGSQLPPVFHALGMRTCPFHVEFKMLGERLEIIEIHSRFGGGFITKLIELSIDNHIFLEYANYLKNGSLPEIRRTADRITAIHFVVCEGGRIEAIEMVDPTDRDWILEHKCGKVVGESVIPATGYYDRPAYFIYDAESREIEAERRALLSRSRIVVH